MIVINIRGTGGSGKSTLVKRVMEHYPNAAHIKVEGRKRPLATTLWFGPSDDHGIQGGPRAPGLLVPGHYDTACGGCDTIKTVDQVYELVRTASLGDRNNVLYEGIMVMDDVTRAVKMDQYLKKVGSKLVVISLTTPIEDCLAGIRARKAERGDDKPLNEKNTRDRMKRQEGSLRRLQEAGVEVRFLGREEGLKTTLDLLMGREVAAPLTRLEKGKTCSGLLEYVTERQAVMLNRGRSPGKSPWTSDHILQSKKFCCVIRDDDRTSREAREVILSLPENKRMGVALTFRLYNRVSTLRALVEADVWGDGNKVLGALEGLEMVFNTNAYRVTLKGGLWNLPTLSTTISRASRKNSWEPRDKAEYTVQMIQGLLDVGPFLAYQIMQDLRWLGWEFKDEDTWCLIGGGALRGITRLQGNYAPGKRRDDRYEHNTVSEKEQSVLIARHLPLLQDLLTQTKGVIPKMNMFEVEHNLCEWDKYERIRTGETPGLSWKPREVS